jgi:hypothetical protein
MPEQFVYLKIGLMSLFHMEPMKRIYISQSTVLATACLELKTQCSKQSGIRFKKTII